MKEDRSWVAPLAFLTFSGILVAAIFAFLQAEHLLLTERGTALIAWLTFVVTGCAFVAALTALFVALRQMKDSQLQVKLQQVNQKINEIAEINEVNNAIYKVNNILIELVKSKFRRINYLFHTTEGKPIDISELEPALLKFIFYFQHKDLGDEISELLGDDEFERGMKIIFKISQENGKRINYLNGKDVENTIKIVEKVRNNILTASKIMNTKALNLQKDISTAIN